MDPADVLQGEQLANAAAAAALESFDEDQEEDEAGPVEGSSTSEAPAEVAEDNGQWIGASAASRRIFAEHDAAEEEGNLTESFPQDASPLPEPQTHAVALNMKELGLQEAKKTVMGLVQHRLNQAGYKVVVDMNSTNTMATFIQLVVEANGGVVSDEQALRAFAAYHSGEHGTQNFSRLLQKLKTEPWNSVAAVPAPTDRFASFTATLDVEGFNFVAWKKDASQLLAFVMRLVSAEGGKVLDLDELLSFCSREALSPEPSFDRLRQQLRAAPWIRGMGPEPMEPEASTR